MQLREKQIITFQKALMNKRFLDRSHAGTGKTAPIACLTGFVIKQTPLDIKSVKDIKCNPPITITTKKRSAFNVTGGKYTCRAIWIQPSSLMQKNADELLAWNTDLTKDQVKVVTGSPQKKRSILNDENTLIWVMTAETFSKYHEFLNGEYGDIFQIVLDEPHCYYRGFHSTRTQQFVSGIQPYMRCHMMTATPTPRGKLNSAYIYCHIIQPSYYGSYEWFMNTHAILDEYGTPTDWIRHDTLWKFLDNYSICWTAKDMYGDVDEVIIRDIIDIDPKIAKAYDQFEAAAMAEIEGNILQATNSGIATLRCRQILAHPHQIKVPSIYDEKGRPVGYDTLCVSDDVTNKLKRILDYAEEGEPIIVFGSFIAEIEMIAAYLKKHKFKVGVIHGEKSQMERNYVDGEFRAGRLDIVVCSAATAGVGFNWGHVNTVLFHSLNYGDDEFLQAVARAKRGIRTQQLRIIILQYVGSIDYAIMWAVHHNSRHSNATNHDNPIIYFPEVQKDSSLKDLNI